MSDPASNTGLFGIHGMTLELRSQRMGLLSSNIANAATPNYKARDLDFAAALKSRMNGADADRATGAATLYRVPVLPAMDGNTVEMGTEQIAFSQNAVAYASSLTFLTDKVNSIRRSLKGE